MTGEAYLNLSRLNVISGQVVSFRFKPSLASFLMVLILGFDGANLEFCVIFVSFQVSIRTSRFRQNAL